MSTRSRKSDVKDFKDYNEFIPCSPVSPLIDPRTSSSTSSSESIPGRNGDTPSHKRSDYNNQNNNHSGEISVCSETSPSPSSPSLIRSSPARLVVSQRSSPANASSNAGGSNSPLICSSRNIVTSNRAVGVGGSNVLPTGNIVPSGIIPKTDPAAQCSPRTHILNSGNRNYGHGSIVRGAGKSAGGGTTSSSGRSDGNGGGSVGKGEDMVKRALVSSNLEYVKSTANDQYKLGNFVVALSLYDRCVMISPGNAVCRCNRAAALISLGRLSEAVRDCEEAVRLDPLYERAHQRLGKLYLRLGKVENAREHLCFQQPDSGDMQILQQVEKHLRRCSEARMIGDWKTVLSEGDAALAAGADTSPQIFACRAEAHLKLRQFSKADSIISNIPKFGPYPSSCSKTKFFGMLAEAYVFYVRAQVELALGRFENAVAEAEKAGKADPRNFEIGKMLKNVPLVKRARDRGNDLFNGGHFVEAASAYGEGLKLDPNNSILYYNRAVCWSKLGYWENSISDCNYALEIQPSYTKALLRRAQSFEKLGMWANSVRDYESLRRESPRNNEVEEGLFRSQVALKKSSEKGVHCLKVDSQVEEISDLDRYRAATSSSGMSVVYFKAASKQECEQISRIVEMLCIRYPSASFLKVDVKESVLIAKREKVLVVPTVKIYKNGLCVEEISRLNQEILESSLKLHYCP